MRSSLSDGVTDVFMRAFAFWMPSPAWLHSDCSPTVLLDVHLSLSGPAALCLSASLWTSVYFLFHQSSWLQTHPPSQTPTPYTTATTPLSSPPGLLHPSLVFPPDTSCEPLMLSLQSTSCGPVTSLASTALSRPLRLPLPLSLYFAVRTSLLTYKQLISICGRVLV